MELDHSQFAHRLVSGMPDAIVCADAEGVIRLWNRGATRIFGFTEAEALGRSLDIIIPERLRERHWQGYRATMRTRQTRYGDGQVLSVPAVRKDGARISVEFTVVPFTNDAGQIMPHSGPPADSIRSRHKKKTGPAVRRVLLDLCPHPITLQDSRVPYRAFEQQGAACSDAPVRSRIGAHQIFERANAKAGAKLVRSRR